MRIRQNTTSASKLLDVAAIPDGYCYILDASALLKDPAIELYRTVYRHLRFDEPAVYILTTVSLREVDDRKYTRDGQLNYFTLMERLRHWSSNERLSSGPTMTPDGVDRIYFLRRNIERLTTPELSWLDRSYGDRHILSLALELRKAGRRAAVVSRDSLMSVVCKELRVPHKFLEPRRGSSEDQASTTESSTSNKPVRIKPRSDNEEKVDLHKGSTTVSSPTTDMRRS